MKIGRRFHGAYIHALTSASLSFGLVHITQLIVGGFIKSGNLYIHPTAFIMIPILILAYSMVFFIAGAIITYVPSMLLVTLMERWMQTGVTKYILCGMFIGLIFLPLCAEVAFVTFHDQDSPTYLARCGEFGLAMVIAGATGGYAFWRRARVIDGDGEAMADHFS